MPSERAFSATSAVESAKAARLSYVSDAVPGITRRRSGKGFTYRDPEGHTIRERAVLRRIKALVIPPAWSQVWICPSATGHIQVTARDAKGRKQYRYHPKWRDARDETKYERMIEFGEALPALRKRVDDDLSARGLPRTKLLATVVRLLELTLIRVGNEEYARANESFGLTTLRNRHVEVDGTKLRFRFRGKSGKLHEVQIADRRLAAVIKRCQAIPGQELFQFIDDEGNAQSIASTDVNDYLRDVMGQDFTAKDFRTWAGSVLAAQRLGIAEGDDPSRCVVEAVKAVAKRLGNTPATCRKHYIHPLVIESYLAGKLPSGIAPDDLAAQEAALLKLLRG
jgi:DNA topoisomerase-1